MMGIHRERGARFPASELSCNHRPRLPARRAGATPFATTQGWHSPARIVGRWANRLALPLLRPRAARMPPSEKGSYLDGIDQEPVR